MTSTINPTYIPKSNNQTAGPTWNSLYRIGAAAALAEVAIILIQAPIFILYPQPVTVLGHFMQFQVNKLLGLLDFDLLLLLGEAISVFVLLGLVAALRKANPALMVIALTLGLGGLGLFLAVNPTFSMLYLSDQYAAAATEAQRSTFLAAGEALLANYNGTAFDLFFIFTGIADLIIAAVMLRSNLFGKATAYLGLLIGAMLLVPPSPSLGMFATYLSYIVILPTVIWDLLVARRLFQLGQAVDGGEK